MDKEWLKANIAPIIGLIVVIACFVLFLIFAKGKLDPANKEIILMILGAVITTLSTVVGYYFGSSQGSTRKTELLSGPSPEDYKPAVLAPAAPAAAAPGTGSYPGVDAGPPEAVKGS